MADETRKPLTEAQAHIMHRDIRNGEGGENRLLESHELLRAALRDALAREQALTQERDAMIDKAAKNGLEHYRQMGRETLAQIERAEAAEAKLAERDARIQAAVKMLQQSPIGPRLQRCILAHLTERTP